MSDVLDMKQPWQVIQEEQQQLKYLYENCMVEGVHYGAVVGDKPSLLQPGGQLLRRFYDLVPKFTLADKKMEWGSPGVEPIFYFRYECELSFNGMVVGHSFGSANSHEPKYRYRWEDVLPPGMDEALCERRTTKAEVFEWQYEKKETTGKYGKPDAYWRMFDDAIEDESVERFQKEKPWKKGEFDKALRVLAVKWRVPNPDIADYINTLEKMSMKRAFMGAILMATGGSQFWTQDVEDIGDMGGIKEWRPTWAQFFHRVVPSIPNLLAGSKTEAERASVVSNLFKTTYNTEKFDPALATEAHDYLIELDKQTKEAVVVEETVALAPQEGFMWLVKLAEEAVQSHNKDTLNNSVEQLTLEDDAMDAQWVESYDLLLQDTKDMGLEIEAPMILRAENV